jgi:phage terminase large subunit
MRAPSFKVREGSLQERFLASHAKIQFYGGGYANGKTSAAAIKTLILAQEYPGMNALLARSTYPKLEDTLKAEFLKWCPRSWIKRKTDKPNNVVLENGSVINFRYVSQQGSSEQDTSSNLLSATYDLIVVDQMEDPEFEHKDFLDLLGRLRGSTRYVGTDTKMPLTGPRFLIITSNPTRNWLYKRIIKPVHDYKAKIKNPFLIVDVEGHPQIELFEGSTYENKENLPQDYIASLEASYTGQMKERFLLGKWGAYEGLVYDQFDEQVHMIDPGLMQKVVTRLRGEHVRLVVVEGYDYGIVSPSCYILILVDADNNLFIVDGFHKANFEIDDQAKEITKIRDKWGIDRDGIITADPDIFKKKPGSRQILSQTVADLFLEVDIRMGKGDNAVIPGITKIRQYLTRTRHHTNPFYGGDNAPHIYFSSHLQFIVDEFGTYMWKKKDGEFLEDEPVDKNDHFLDALKYALSRRPNLGKVVIPFRKRTFGLEYWAESDAENGERKVRYG